jgi:hypothetical protein
MQQQFYIPQYDPKTLLGFAFVCDGEVAYIIKLPPEQEHFVSVLQSNPTIVEFKDDEAAMGDKYVEGKFIKQ